MPVNIIVDLSKQGNTYTMVLMVTSTAIGGTLQYGYNLAIMNGPTVFIQNFVNETYMERWGIQLGVYEVTLIWTFMVSIFSLGSFIGALIAGPMSVRFGRKKTMLLNNVFLFSSSLLALLSRTAKSFEMIIISRFLVGINAGISMNVPMYFGESAPKHLRGAVSLSSTVFTSFGLVLGQVVCLRYLLGSEPYWQYLFASNAIPGLIQFLTFPWFPENPRYLLIDWRQRALQRLQGCEVQREELDEILQEQNETKGERAKQPWELFTDCSVCWQLITVAVLSSAMQLCGNDSKSKRFYASYVFQEAGISGGQIQYVTIGTGVCEFTTCILCNLLIERLGRRLMLTGIYVLMAGWAVVFTVALSLEVCFIHMTCIFTYILSFGMGLAGVTGILPTEIFNQTTRPAVYMAAGSLIWLNLFIIEMIFSFLVSGLGQYCFLPFGAVCLLTASYIQKVLPETKGKTLSMITKEFYRLSYCGQVKMDPEGKQAQYQLGEIFHSTAL
uniref:Solute carrier family 2, facilitated glucose transporter member 5 n=1 Tax=Cyprinus carpio carpio TaxID=630221 RepID=A0A8C1CKK5_CYPCA